MAPRQGFVRIATGRDAADTAFMSNNGGVVILEEATVWPWWTASCPGRRRTAGPDSLIAGRGLAGSRGPRRSDPAMPGQRPVPAIRRRSERWAEIRFDGGRVPAGDIPAAPAQTSSAAAGEGHDRVAEGAVGGDEDHADAARPMLASATVPAPWRRRTVTG